MKWTRLLPLLADEDRTEPVAPGPAVSDLDLARQNPLHGLPEVAFAPEVEPEPSQPRELGEIRRGEQRHGGRRKVTFHGARVC